jgi:hypothetical protein
MLMLSKMAKDMGKFFPQVHMVAYVDDVIFYCEDDAIFDKFVAFFPRYCQSNFGFVVSIEKSQVAKRGGVWLVESLKYLGFRLNHVTGEFASETRSGRHLKHNFRGLIQLAVLFGSEDLAKDGFYIRVTRLMATAGGKGSQAQHVLLFLFFTYYIFKQWDHLKIASLVQRDLFRMDPSMGKVLKRFQELGTLQHKDSLDWAGITDVPAYLTLFQDLMAELPPYARITERKLSDLPYVPFGGLIGGLVQSRLYQGALGIAKMDTPTGSQDFVLRIHPASLAQVIQTKSGGSLSLFNGSSYATHEMLNMTKNLRGLKRKLLMRGAMPVDLAQIDFARTLQKGGK